MKTYKVTRRWYTVQVVKAESEEAAFDKAKDDEIAGGLCAEDFYEEDHEVERVTPCRA